MTTIPRSTHLHYLRLALEQARRSPPKPTNYCVGAVLVSFPSASDDTTPANIGDEHVQETGADEGIAGTILSTGYTLELEGNTHAEQCCLSKLAAAHDVDDDNVHFVLLSLIRADGEENNTLVLYTTMEPCILRLSGAVPCVDRIIAVKHIRTVVCGVSEPDTFVKRNEGRAKLEAEGIEVVCVGGLEEEILRVARAGHVGGDV